MKIKILLVLAIATLFISSACTATSEAPAKEEDKTETTETKTEDAPKEEASSDDSPKAAVTEFAKAYQEKDIETLKKRFAKGTLAQMEEGAKKAGTTLDESLKKFVEAAELPIKGTPETRNEKIDGDKATIEVKAEGEWQETPLVKEDGTWKLDFGRMQPNK